MRKITVVALLSLLACIPARAQSWVDRLEGIYLTVDGGAQVVVSKANDGTFSGKIVWLDKDKDRLDIHNPDRTRQAAPLLGLVILRGFKANEQSKRWEGGTIYDPKNGKTYDAFIWRDPRDPGVLRLKGYVLGIKWLGRETRWTAEKGLRP